MGMLRTKSQQKKICGTCPYAKASNLLGDSVVLLIIHHLLPEKRSFSDFELYLPGVSTKTVSEKLKFLEQEAIITKEEVHSKPNRVYYTLTQKGKQLRPVMKALRSFGEKCLS